MVGKSGCGKSTLAKVLLGLETATEGKVVLDNQELSQVPVQKRRPQVVSHLQMVFQNPFDTLNPSHTRRRADLTGDPQVRGRERPGESARAGHAAARHRQAAARLLPAPPAPAVGRTEAAGRDRARLRRQPARGGRRRAGLGAGCVGPGGGRPTADGDPAREPYDAPVHQPRPVAGALSGRPGGGDVSRHDRRAGHHGRGVLAALSPLYRGAAVGDPDRRHLVEKKHIVLEGDIPSAVNPPPGCPFQTRCPRKLGRICEEQEPPIRERGAATRSPATSSPTRSSAWTR